MTQQQVRVAAVMTAPRHEITWARTYIQKALSGMGIPLNVSGGVFYGQCMQSMLSELVEKDVDYALTIDFDSVFTGDDIQRLVSIVAQEQSIDALAPAQAKRGFNSLLGSCGIAKEVQWDGRPVQVKTAHFGLTVIDLKKLASVPKPWFMAIPDEDGNWGEGRTDDDVYFWKRWGEAGNTVYIDPGVKLGHLQEMVTVFDDNMQIRHMYPKDWVKENYGSDAS